MARLVLFLRFNYLLVSYKKGTRWNLCEAEGLESSCRALLEICFHDKRAPIHHVTGKTKQDYYFNNIFEYK